MFALPAAAFAMYTTARPENRKAVAGFLFSVAFTSFLTGITEPIEFMFMFLAPVLYITHAVLSGAAMAVSNLLGVHCGFGFSAGAIDYLLNWNLATRPFMVIPIGLAFGALYYFLFVAIIKTLNLPTPGRMEQEMVEAPLEKFGGMAGLALAYIEHFGGKGNIQGVDGCITRLRVTVRDLSIIDDENFKRLGASGVLRPGKNAIQVVVGTKAENLADTIRKHIKQM